MINETERRNLILETIGQLGKFIDLMNENEEGHSDNDMKLLKTLSSFADQAKMFTKLLKVDHVTKETIPK
jgi:hypothetical protein